MNLPFLGTAVDARMELGIGPHESTLMQVSSTHLDAYPLHPHQTAENNTPDVLTVQVQTGEIQSRTSHVPTYIRERRGGKRRRGDVDHLFHTSSDAGGVQELLVEVERPGHRKKFLGGYRHQLTGVEFHHAAVQTLQKKRPDRGVEAFSRDTQVSAGTISSAPTGTQRLRVPPGVQTVELSRQEQQCGVDVSTQMTRAGCYVSCCRDRLVSPGTYTTASEYLERRLRAVSPPGGRSCC